MPLHVYAASLALGFCEYAADKPNSNTTSNLYAWHIVGNTGDELVKHPFSLGCILCAGWPMSYSHDAAIVIL